MVVAARDIYGFVTYIVEREDGSRLKIFIIKIYLFVMGIYEQSIVLGFYFFRFVLR